MRSLLYVPPALCLMALTALPSPAPSATLVVDWSGGGDHTTIQEAIDAAAPGDTVEVVSGTYTGPLNRDLDTGGKAITVRSRSGRASTIIDCQHQGRGFNIHLGEDWDTVLRGFTVRRGAAAEGPGARIYNASPIIEDCVFEDNVGTEGGAIHVRADSSPQITLCRFEDNWAYDYGGAIYSYLATPYVSQCAFVNNLAGINGGAISLKTGSSARIYECAFTGNSAQDGGGIYISTLDAQPPPERDIPDASIVNYCRFVGNTATRGGGLFVNAYSWSSCAYSTFAHNTASQGGAVYVLTAPSPTLSIDNCTMARNTAQYGAGVFVAGGDDQFQPVLKTSIIAFNVLGEAVHRQWGAPATVDLTFSYGNEGGDALPGTRNRFVDPRFCNLYDDDFRLCSNSPCLKINNVGNPPWSYYNIGATTQQCGDCTSPVQGESWGSIKAMFR
ncbi:MAG: right-handed parallel beta-helix repeat-containing protein [Candidatus Eisenbacteria bacterium]|nr:right-handed parallel beta-helix repeat-containing protein [Candidatus Eisenbacteria bacterium]